MKAVELWKAARPLFERSSQMKDIVKIDAKLAEVDSAILVEYEEQLERLSELHVSVSAPEAYISEEEEEDELAQGSDVGDKGRKVVLA
jgi:exoribonuclease II